MGEKLSGKLTLVRATVFCKIASLLEESEDCPDLPEAWGEWVGKKEADRNEVIRDMRGVSKGILAKCIDAREEEQDSFDKSGLEEGKKLTGLEEGKKLTGDSDDSSNVGMNVPRCAGLKWWWMRYRHHHLKDNVFRTLERAIRQDRPCYLRR